MKYYKRMLVAATLVVALGLMVGCGTKDKDDVKDNEKATEAPTPTSKVKTTESVGEDVVDTVEDVGEDVKDGVTDVGKDIKDGVTNTASPTGTTRP